MAIPKRGARNIIVDGQPYRWYVRRKLTYRQGLCDSTMQIAVEHAEGKGCVLVASLPQFHTGNWLGGVTGPVVPADVERCIRAALDDGWMPTQAGRTFVLERAAGNEAHHA